LSFAFALLLGTLAAALAAVPAALRAPEPGPTWLVLAGAAALVLGPALGGIARGRPLSDGVCAALAGLGLSTLPLAVFANRLQISTHHRPLGAVTFAIAALVMTALALAVALRWLDWARSANAASRRSVWARRALASAALAGPLLLALMLATTAAGRHGLFDVTLCLGLAALALLGRWPAAVVRLGSKAGIPVWLIVVCASLVAAFGPTRAAAEDASPALYAPFGWALR